MFFYHFITVVLPFNRDQAMTSLNFKSANIGAIRILRAEELYSSHNSVWANIISKFYYIKYNAISK